MYVISNRRCSSTNLCTLTLLLFIGILVGSISAEVANDTEESEQNATLEQCQNKNYNFFWEDYVVLAIMLIVSCGIGVFYGFFGAEQTTSADFLLGGSSMGTFPMAMSLAASFVTAIELLGNPSEVYLFGTQYWMICFSFLFAVPIASKLYLPVYMKLRLTSSYEYLSMRFNTQTRIFASVLYSVQMILYTSVAVYAPALALSRVTGLNLYLAVTLIYVVCIFYASQGGMKAVIMTDTFQAAVLLGSILLIVYLGEQFVGGTGVVWSANYNSDRLEIFNFDPDPTARNSFWPVVVGGTFYWMTMFCSNQASIQKYLSVETLGQARTALWVSCFGLILIFTVNIYTGMILVAKYKDCDPILTGEVRASDELLPLFVISILGHFRGVTGFFVAGIFAASLGTVAAALNSLAAITCEDFLPNIFGIYMPPAKGALWAKWISIGFGALSFVLVFIVEQLGSVMQIAISFNGMVGGITLGLFSLGMFIPWANTKGAILGSTLAFALVMWMGIGQQISIASGSFSMKAREVSTNNCSCTNQTFPIMSIPQPEHEEVFCLYRVSFLWYSTIGFMVTLILGFIFSFIFGLENPEDVNPDLISPIIYNFLHSLPNNVKERLNIPLKMKNKPKDNGIQLTGIVNMNIDLSDETRTKIGDKDKEFNEKSVL